MSCKRCGQCCSHLILSFNIDEDWPDEKEWLVAHQGISIEYEEEDTAYVRFNLPCRYLIPAQGRKPASCRLHPNKPKVCQEYPDAETIAYLQAHPEVTPNCGYR